MYSRSGLAFKYLRYYLGASNGKGHGMHSPFVYHFIRKILNDNAHYPEYDRVEGLREILKKNNHLLSVEDFGAGSVKSASVNRSISSITRNAAKPPKYGKLLFRMVKAWKPANMLELGTSLGITTAYLSLANQEGRVVTLEGAGEVAKIAAQNLGSLHIKNAEIIQGNFDTTLPGILPCMPDLDFVFIDGNHRLEPTKKYFESVLPKMHNDSVIVFDDVHWSKEMEEAWAFIKAHPAVRCSIDLFFLGIVLFRKEFMTRQHFMIRF